MAGHMGQRAAGQLVPPVRHFDRCSNADCRWRHNHRDPATPRRLQEWCVPLQRLRRHQTTLQVAL